MGEECLYELGLPEAGLLRRVQIWLRHLPGNKAFELNPPLHLDGLEPALATQRHVLHLGLQSAGTVAGKYETYPTKSIPVHVTSNGHPSRTSTKLSTTWPPTPGITYTTSSRLEYSPTISTSNYTKYYYPSDFFHNLETF